MKIPFDIKYRPQIESGEFKVETRDGLPARVVCWDANSYTPIVFLATEYDGLDDTYKEYTYSCNNFGRAFSIESPRDLFLVTPEPELTPLEDLLSTYLKGDFEYFSTKKWDEKKWNEVIRIQAAELLSLARKQLQPEIDAMLEDAYKTADEVQYRKGREEALQDLPRWKKCPLYFEHGDIGKTNKDDDVLSYQGYRILLSDLAKLPKED